MKKDPEVREAEGLQKEQKMFQRYATREGAPKCESEYYLKMANSTGSRINWRVLDSKYKKRKDERKSWDS